MAKKRTDGTAAQNAAKETAAAENETSAALSGGAADIADRPADAADFQTAAAGGVKPALANTDVTTENDAAAAAKDAKKKSFFSVVGNGIKRGQKKFVLWVKSLFGKNTDESNLIKIRPLSSPDNPFTESNPLELCAVNVMYGDNHALKEVTMTIAPNEVTAFIGPSGCGKSTLLRCLNRMNDDIDDCAVTGSFSLGGVDMYRGISPALLRKNVGMVFQKPNVFPVSIYDNMIYGPRTYGVRGKKELNAVVESCLVNANLWDEVKDRLRESALTLSGGQQQRLCIARCMSINPKIILMDEPTASLDPISTAKIEELIVKLKQRYTIVIVTHNMQQAMRVADKTAYFLLGNLVEYGETKQIFEAPGEEETKRYLSGIYS